MTTKILTGCFYILFFFTPLFFLKYNSELFEYNKMMLVYVLTTIITGTWLIRMINYKVLIFKRTPLDIPILLFLLSQVLSTIFSVDIHTSIWGYYSRSNGGLLSVISYILLYYALVGNFAWDQAIKFLKAGLWGGLVVALYAIPEHFGVSPSCILLQGSFTADCWVQDVQSRVFATLGQPNWLAAYLEMLIFPALYLALTTKHIIRYLLFTACYYLAFTFTYSRGATLGFLAGLAIFVFGLAVNSKIILHLFNPVLVKLTPSIRDYLKKQKSEVSLTSIKTFIWAIGIFILVNLFFGSALTGDFRLLKFGSTTARPGITQENSVGTQLENGGTESGSIRLIVWQGALNIFKHYPIFGSGVETFAYSYYVFRPAAHNLTSEWDFLYNKAHNEYLNYLATTGIVGFMSYNLLVGMFIFWCFKYLFILPKKVQFSVTQKLLISSILASYTAYLIQNFFGFSVVIVALFFFLFPALAFLGTGVDWRWKKEGSKIKFFSNLTNLTIYRKPLFTTLSVWIIGITLALTIFILAKYWFADTLYNIGQNGNNSGSPGQAFNTLLDAVSLNPNEPLYHSELGNAAASSAVSLATDDATTSAILKAEAIKETNKALAISPANSSIWRTTIRTYYDLSLIDPSYNQKTLATFDQTIKLAPTDPKLYYNKALVLETMNDPTDEIYSLQQAIKLKPNYADAIFKLGVVYQSQGDLVDAKTQFERILQLTPQDPGATTKLQQIATASGQAKQ